MLFNSKIIRSIRSSFDWLGNYKYSENVNIIKVYNLLNIRIETLSGIYYIPRANGAQGVSPGRGYKFRPAIYTRGKGSISEV